MAWFWGLLFFFLALGIILFGIGYEIVQGMVGRKAAPRQLFYAPFNWMAAGLFIFVLPQLLLYGKYGWENFSILFSSFYLIGISIWFLICFFRRQKAGNLLLNIGKTRDNTIALSRGLSISPLTFLMTWFIFNQFSHFTSSELRAEISKLVIFWSYIIFCVTIVRPQLGVENAVFTTV